MKIGLRANRALALSLALGVVGAAYGQIGQGVYVVNTGHVIATFQGSSAGYDSELYLDQAGVGPIFPNHSTSVGTTFDLGIFSAGDELIFRLHVVNTGNDWKTGGGYRNADGLAHANIVMNWNNSGETWVGFEDLYGGGDGDYDDHTFSFSNTAVPEPASLMVLGLGGLALIRRKR